MQSTWTASPSAPNSRATALTPIEQLKALQEVFGGGLLGAIVGLTILAFLALFTLYVRAKNAHLETAVKLEPIVKLLPELIAEATEELKAAREVLEIHRPKRRRPAMPLDVPTIVTKKEG